MYHETNDEHNRKKLVHKLKISDCALQIPGLNNEEFEVNSIHHQTVQTCPFNAEVLATYNGKYLGENEVGEIESLTYWPNYPAHTVQWHPKLWGSY